MVRVFFDEDVPAEPDPRRRLLKGIYKCVFFRDQIEVLWSHVDHVELSAGSQDEAIHEYGHQQHIVKKPFLLSPALARK